jgi:hypothetical protein
VNYHLGQFFEQGPGAEPGKLVPLADELEIFIESHGLLGQRVLQTYRYRFAAHFEAAPMAPLLRLVKLEIVPNVAGGTSAVTTVAR